MALDSNPPSDNLITKAAQNLAAPEAHHANMMSDVFSGFGHAFESQYDGARQMCGAKVDLSYAQNENSTQKIGHAIGDATMFIGGAVLMKKLPVLGSLADGKFASIATGGVLGMTNPLHDGQDGWDRLKNAGLGASTMSLMEFGPGALGRLSPVAALPEKGLASGIARYGVANGMAGFANTEGQSFINTGHGASAHDLIIATGTWMAMGTAFHQMGNKFEALQKGKAEAKANYAPENAPWKFKDVKDINAADLTPGQKLEPGNYRVSFMSQGAERKANLYISDGAVQGARPAPVVTHLHGLNPNGEAEGILSELNYYKLADQDGAVVAMLQGRNGLKGLGKFQSFHDTNFGYAVPDKGVAPYSDQVAFGDMMGIIKNHVPNANTDKIAVSGFSLGAKMANRLAATRADVGVVASIHGTMDTFDEQLMNSAMAKHPVDGIFVLGTKDKVLPLKGGKSLFTLGLENNNLSRPTSQAEFWGRSNGNPLAVTSDNANFSTREWRSPTRENTVTEYVVKNGAHAIDGAPPRKNLIQFLMGAPKPAEVFDARQKTWDFMLRSLIARDVSMKPGEFAAAS